MPEPCYDCGASIVDGEWAAEPCPKHEREANGEYDPESWDAANTWAIERAHQYATMLAGKGTTVRKQQAAAVRNFAGILRREGGLEA